MFAQHLCPESRVGLLTFTRTMQLAVSGKVDFTAAKLYLYGVPDGHWVYSQCMQGLENNTTNDAFNVCSRASSCIFECGGFCITGCLVREKEGLNRPVHAGVAISTDLLATPPVIRFHIIPGDVWGEAFLRLNSVQSGTQKTSKVSVGHILDDRIQLTEAQINMVVDFIRNSTLCSPIVLNLDSEQKCRDVVLIFSRALFKTSVHLRTEVQKSHRLARFLWCNVLCKEDAEKIRQAVKGNKSEVHDKSSLAVLKRHFLYYRILACVTGCPEESCLFLKRILQAGL